MSVAGSRICPEMERVLIEKIIGNLRGAGIVQVQLALFADAKVLLHCRDNGRAAPIEGLFAGLFLGKAHDHFVIGGAAQRLNLSVVVPGIINGAPYLRIVNRADEFYVDLRSTSEIDAPWHAVPKQKRQNSGHAEDQ